MLQTHCFSTATSIDKIVEFLKRYTTYKSSEKLREKVEGHLRYKTCRIYFDDDGAVYAACFWNISDDQQYAHLTDLVIREDWRGKDLMRTILKDGLKIWPVKYLKFDRDYTEDGSSRGRTRMLSVERFLKRRA